MHNGVLTRSHTNKPSSSIRRALFFHNDKTRGESEGDWKCVYEELSESTLVMFTYESPDDTHLNINLFDPNGVEIYSQTDKSKGSHGFTTDKEGDYKGKGHPRLGTKKKTYFSLIFLLLMFFVYYIRLHKETM